MKFRYFLGSPVSLKLTLRDYIVSPRLSHYEKLHSKCSRPGVGNPRHACQSWHATRFSTAREVVKIFQKHFLNFETVKNLHSARNKRLICCVLLYCLFSHHYFFITVVTSLLCTLAFYAVGNPEVNRQACGQVVKIRCEIISRVVDS